MALFGLSPLAVYYHRMVSLDNIGTLWLLAAMVAATSRRRSLGAAFWAGTFSAVAVLSKETIAILLPVVFWLIWQQSHQRTRTWHLAVYSVTVGLLTAFYPLFAVLRGELFPGRGHVSLLWAVWWQLFGRTGSGFLLSNGSAANGLLTLWLGTDRWLLFCGLAATLPGLFTWRLRPLAFGLLLPTAMALTGGYLPYFYVTAMFPFAALLIGGVADTLWNPVRSELSSGSAGWRRSRPGSRRCCSSSRSGGARWSGRPGRTARPARCGRPPGSRRTCPRRTSWSSTTTCGWT